MTKSEIQFVRSLSDKRVRDRESLFVAEGEKLVGEIRSSHLRIRKIYASTDRLPYPEAEHVTAKEMERISMLKTPSTILAVVEKPRCALDRGSLGEHLALALDGVQNPGNLGTIIRLADWWGISDIVCSEDCADCFNPKVVQATMGAILRVSVHYVPDLAALLASASDDGIAVYGTFLDGDDIYSADITSTGIIVMGSEGRGITDSCARHVTRRLFIPPYPADRRGSESLNVAVATAIVCAEFRRRASF